MPVKYLGADVNPFKRQCTLKDFFSADPPLEAETPASPPMSPSTPLELPPMPPMPLSPRELGQQRKALQAILQAPTGAIAQIEYEAATGQGSSSWPVDVNAPSTCSMMPSSDEESESDDVRDPATLIIEAAVYKWTFDNPELIHVDHPLFGIKYFGQVAREKGTAIEQCEARWSEERAEAKKKNKEVGLLYMIKAFGYEAATRRMIETFKGSMLEAQNWANEREIKLIAEHGGPLRDVDRRLRQTLNLTNGGRGDAITRWYANEAISRKRWNKYKKLLQVFYDREGHLNVPGPHVEDGVALGKIVANMRHRDIFLADHPERQAWVRERGWVDNPRDERWERVKELLQAFYDREGHLNVPQAYVEDGEPLGRIVLKMRGQTCQFLKGHPEREAWVRAHGWVDSARDERWERVKQLLQAFYDREGHLNVPFYHVENGVALGTCVNLMRSQGCFLTGHSDRVEWVRARGWVKNARDARWERVMELLQAFFEREGHINVHTAHVEDGVALGKTVINIRAHCVFIKGHPDRAQWCYERGFEMHTRDPVKNRERWAALGVVA